jgi:hypothetical protein
MMTLVVINNQYDDNPVYGKELHNSVAKKILCAALSSTASSCKHPMSRDHQRYKAAANKHTFVCSEAVLVAKHP